LSKVLIAIVEDDRHLLVALESLLESAGYEVLLYFSGEDFLVSDRLQDINCLISDIGLPGMNGIELLTYLKKEARFNKIPVVILTTSASQTEQLYQQGARLVIIKPSKVSMLRTALEHILNTDFSKGKNSHSLNGKF